MASVVVTRNTRKRFYPSELSRGTYFLGQVSGEPHVKTDSGSTRLNTGQTCTNEFLNSFGPAELIESGEIISLTV